MNDVSKRKINRFAIVSFVQFIVDKNLGQFTSIERRLANNERFLNLLPFSLPACSNSTVRVAVQQVRGNVTTIGNTDIVLMPNRRQFVQANIDSVSDRVFAGSNFILSATNSYDPDDQATDMTYEWRCVRMKRNFTLEDSLVPQWTQPCDALATAAFNQKGGAVLMADLSALANAYYEVEVKVTATASASCYNSIRTGSDRVTFEVVSDRIPSVTAVRCSSLAACMCDGTVIKASKQVYVNAGESFTLGTGCADLNPQYTLKWEVIPTESGTVSNFTDMSKPKFLSPATARLVKLVVPHGAQSEYTFRINVLDEQNTRVNSATITVPINMPPTQGYVDVTPRNGVAMVTFFKISARGWQDPDSEHHTDELLLRYRFEVRDAVTRANVMDLSHDFSSFSSLADYLPLVTASKRTQAEAIQGDVVVVVYVQDFLGATSSCDYTKDASGAELSCPSVLMRLPSVPSTLGAISMKIQNVAGQQDGRAVTQSFTELYLHCKSACLNNFDSHRNVTQANALDDSIPVRRNIIAHASELVSSREAISGALANSNNVQAIVSEAIHSPSAFDVVSDALSVSNALLQQLPSNVEISGATRSFAHRSFEIYDRVATLIVRETDAVSAATTTTTTTTSPRSANNTTRVVREKLLDSMGAMCTSLTSGAIDDHVPIVSENAVFSAACQKTRSRHNNQRASSRASGTDAKSSLMVLNTANSPKNSPPVVLGGTSEVSSGVLVLQSRHRSLVLADNERPAKGALAEDQSALERSHVTQVQMVAAEARDTMLDLQIPVVLASHLKGISENATNDVVRSRVGAMEAGGSGSLSRTALTRIFVDEAYQLSGYYLATVSRSRASLPETRRFSYPMRSVVKTNALMMAMTTVLNPAQTLVPYNQLDLTFKKVERFLSQPHGMILISALLAVFLGLLIFDLIFMHYNYDALVDIQRELYLSTGSLDPMNHLLEARNLRAELPRSKRACCVKLCHAMLVHHPLISTVLSTAPCKCCWNRRSFLLLQTQFSAQAQLSILFLDIFTMMFVEGLFVESTEVKEQCIFMCYDWDFCCESSTDLFSLRSLLRRLLVCLVSQIFLIPAAKMVPLLFRWRARAVESVSHPIKRKQLPMASLAYLFENQRDAFAEKLDFNNVDMQAVSKDVAKMYHLSTADASLLEQLMEGPPSRWKSIIVQTDVAEIHQSSKIGTQTSPEQATKSQSLSAERLFQRRSEASPRSTRRSTFVQQMRKVIESNRDRDMVADTLQHIVSLNILRSLEWQAQESPEVRGWLASLAILSWIAVFLFCALPLFLCLSFSISMSLSQVFRMLVNKC